MERKQLFSNGTEYMAWQAENCERCVKAVFYNQKKNTFPQYRCAIQRDIELAAVTDGCGNERAFNATKSRICPHIQTERKKSNKIDNEPKLF